MHLNEARLQALLQLNEMTAASLKEITDFALEAAVKLTQSKIGYLAFMNADETVLTMHSWSKAAMSECAIVDKPIIYPIDSTGLWGEAVRQRKPVITNDYQAPNPLKRGYPPGHVHVLRHMNIPVFEGDRVVVVSGVGNKEEPYNDSDVRQLTLLMQGMWQLIQRKRDADLVRLNEARLQALVDLQQMKAAPLNQITDFALETAVKLTQSKLGYLAFVSADEKIMTMHSWSKAAMDECAIADKPLVYPVETTGLWGEAVRQRKAIVTNDYQAANPFKKGYPPGHVQVFRHMNVPIFDHHDSKCPCLVSLDSKPDKSAPVCDHQDRVVVVAGVGNKEGPYDETDVRQLTLLMQGMWQLIQHEQQQEEIRRARDELELRVKERTAELEEARLAAEAASLAKSTFLATMSHEIRTPLNAVIGMTELVLKSQLSTRQRDFLLTVKDSGEALLSVINDILDFSKIEAGKLILEHRIFDLKESLGDTMKSFAIPAHEKDLELTCFIHPDVPRMVIGDYNRLRQIVVNLIGNAIKFTDKGEVGLEVVQEHCDDDKVTLHFTANDTGIGVPQEKRATIFKMFEQVDSTTTRRHGGTGLGLAIAARLVGLMNGRIWLESRAGGGSAFHFTIRLHLSQEDPLTLVAPEPACINGMRVLVVDDNATNRHVLQEVLTGWKMIPDTVSSAQEAIAAIGEAHQQGRLYELIITDAHIPDIDGFGLAEEIKHNPDFNSTIIMMLTSADCPEDIARCKQLGIMSYLLKPVKQSELLEAIQLALGIVIPEPAVPMAVADHRDLVKNLRILVAEDSLVNQQLIVALLEGQGHNVTLANNGREAAEAADASAFDLILMDVQMPVMDGFEATSVIRTREKESGIHIPIVAMTAYALKGDQERCLQAGMDNYISKPIRAQDLFDMIDHMFAEMKQRAEEGSLAPDAVNWPSVLQVANGNKSVAKEMLKTASQELMQLMTTIHQTLTGDDYEGLRYAAHAMRGSGWYFGATSVCELTGKLEEVAGLHDRSAAAEITANLEDEVNRVLHALSIHLCEN